MIFSFVNTLETKRYSQEIGITGFLFEIIVCWKVPLRSSFCIVQEKQSGQMEDSKEFPDKLD